jgi:very-short-patch-repair endonuclease/predicted transcriptional regulator of viral defense system
MARVKPTTAVRARSAEAWALAAKQHGIITRRELISLGFSPDAIEHRIAQGRLHRIRRGVYAVGRPGLTRHGRWMAAVLACGSRASLSHRSAAALWGIGDETAGRIDISVRRRSEHRLAGIRARSRPALPETDIVMKDGIPVTQPVRTLLDLATVLGPREVERAVNEADKRDLVDPEGLREQLPSHAGEPGVAMLRALLDRDTFRLSDEELEVAFRPIAIGAGLPQPETKARVNGFEVDFFWPDLKLVIETDGLRYHRTPSAQARDHVRDQAHTAAGYTTLRFTHRQVKYEGAYVELILRNTASRLRNAPS